MKDFRFFAWGKNSQRLLLLLCLTSGLNVFGVDAAFSQITNAVRRGQTLLQQGLVNDAIAAFRAALAASPQSLEAKLGLAQAYQKAGKDAEAWTAFQQVLAQDPNNQIALRAVGALGAYRQEWQVGGISALNTLLRISPNDLQARSQRALLLGYQGRYQDSFADYQIVLRSNPTPESLLGAAQIYTYSGDSQQGLALFKRYLATGKQIPIYNITAYAQALRETGNISQSIQVLKTGLNVANKPSWLDAEMRSSLAISYQANGQLKEALAVIAPLRGKKEANLFLARALTTIGRRERNTELYREGITVYRQVLAETKQPTPSLIREVADVYSELPSERVTALELYERYLAVQPNDKLVLTKQLTLQRQLGKISQADFTNRLLTSFQPLPNNPAELRELGQALLQLDPPEPALLPIYQGLLTSGVDMPFLNFRVAQILLERKDLAGARKSLEAYKATKMGASDVATDLLLADIFRQEGNLEASAQAYQSLISSTTANKEYKLIALRSLAGIRISQGRAEEAIALYDQLLQQNPNDLRTALARTSIAYQAKRITQTEAETVLNRYLQTQSLTDAPPELINLVASLPPTMERESLYEQLLKVSPDNTLLQLRRLQVLAARDPGKAKLEVQELINRNPDNISAYFLQGELAQALGDFDLASAAYSSILKRQPDNVGALMALGGVRFNQRRFAEARDIYNQVLKLNPKEPMAQRNLAELSVVQDQRFEALDRFKKLYTEQQLTGSADTEFLTRIQKLEVDILKRRGFQPYWERY
jgi:tetratricopeptide (TPR) repeat protein